ncbi:TetR family transcriptional regulator [bacterium]|nr:TetR family transcriptional regulator [bacterium]
MSPRPPPVRRAGRDAAPAWRRRAEARPEEILEAALQEFETRGFDAARMEDIAARARLSKAGVYLYFNSKEALLRELIVSRVAPVAMAAERLAAAGQADPGQALRMVYELASERLSDPHVFAVPRLVLSISNRFPEIADLYRTEVINRMRTAIGSLVAAGAQTGVFRVVPVDVAMRLIAGPVLFEMIKRHAFRDPPPDDLKEQMTLQFDLLMIALAPERPT